MIEFKVESLAKEKFNTIEEFQKINESKCDDILSHILFYKIDAFSRRVSYELHNANYGKQHLQKFLLLSLTMDKMSEKELSQKRTLELLDITQKLYTAPNLDLAQVKIRNRPIIIQKGIVNGEENIIMFNPYLIAIPICELHLRLSYDKRILKWYEQDVIRKESIEKVIEVVVDKYSYVFLDLSYVSVTFER